MRSKMNRFAIALFATTALASAAHAQASYPCVNEAPNPYKQVNGWEKMSVTNAAQAVQRSAFASAYAKHATNAQKIVDALNVDD